MSSIQASQQHAAEFAQRVQDRQRASDSVAVSLGMAGIDRTEYVNRFISTEDKVILTLADQVRSLQEDLAGATGDGLSGQIADALWESVDDKGIKGRVFREDCDYLAGVAAKVVRSNSERP